MTNGTSEKNIVIVNQAVNYLTIGICNAFSQKVESVTLITGSIHVQGEELESQIRVVKINRWAERPAVKKLFSYLFGTLRIWWLLITRYRRHEVFFISLPPMAYLLSIVLPHRCSMLIWDVYPDVFKITGMKETHILYRIWSRLNRISFRKAYRVFTIGERMADLLSKYINSNRVLITPIWSIFQQNGKVINRENPFIEKHGLGRKFIVQYSGNIGLTHNVEVMVELAELMRNEKDVLFQIIGRGPRMPHLQALVKEKALPNCQFLPFQSDEMFPFSLSAADLGVVILDQVTSKGSVPSKSYNLMSYGIPSLYIASEESELHDYALKYRHAKCVDHENLDEAVSFILELKENGRFKKELSDNAVKAAENYRRSNADHLVKLYLEENISEK